MSDHKDKGKEHKGPVKSFIDKWRDGDTGVGDMKGPGTHTHTHTSMDWKGGTGGTDVKLPLSVRVPKTCVHDGQTPSFTIERYSGRGKIGDRGPVAIYGARGHVLMSPSTDLTHLDLLIDMSGSVKRPKPFAKSGSWKARDLGLAAFPEVLSLDWPDMTAPTHVPAKFWVKLLAILPPAVCISCMGSHGRTGTAMACLLVASGMSADKAIAKVRQEHCNHAIETPAQEAYIHKIAKALGH